MASKGLPSEWAQEHTTSGKCECLALCIKPLPKPEFARRSTCCRVMRWSCGQLLQFGLRHPEPHIHQSASVWHDRVDCFWERLSTCTKNKACSFLSWSVEVWSHVEYSSSVILYPSNISHTKTLVIFLRNTPSGIQTIAKN